MALDNDEIRKRQQRRRIEQQRRQERKKAQRRMVFLGLIAAAVVLILCGILILLLGQSPDKPDSAQSVPGDTTQTLPPQPTEPETIIHLAFGGDLNITDKVVASGVSADGYDYTDVFMDVAPLFAGADAAVLNFEGNLCGAPYGSASTSAPPELLEALSAIGVDMLQTANSCAINNGLLGLTDTIDGIRNAGMEPLGTFSSQAEFEKYRGFTLRNIRGIKVAFVAFTKGMDGMALPEGSETCVNLLYTDYTSTYQKVNTDGIKEVLQAVDREKPDVTIALLHWGSEYNSQISKSQEKIVKLMQEEGVDAILGTHSHYVQKMDYDESTGALVAYSLGDFFGDGDKNGTNYSVVLELEVTKYNKTGDTKITAFTGTPIFNLTPEAESTAPMKLLRIEPAIASYEANSIEKVSPEVYAAMKSALSKIHSRLDPED